MSSYATTSDLYVLGLPQGALTVFTVPQQQQALDAASDLADSYLGSRYVLPLTKWGQDIRRAVCHIAAFDLLCARGFNPDDPSDKLIEQRATRAEKWLQRISDEEAAPLVTDSSSGVDPDQGTPFVGQVQVIPQSNATPLTMGGPPPSIVDSTDGLVQVGPPRFRGW